MELQLSYVLNKLKPKKMKQALQTVPTELPNAYQATIDRIIKRGPEYINLAFEVLGWILQSRRPLRMRELSESITVELGDTDREEEEIPDPMRLIEVCKGLVIYDRSSGIILFAHYTVQEFLLRECCPHQVVGSVQVTLSCLTYLLYDVFNVEGPLPKEHARQHEFLDYSARYWVDHIEDLDTENEDIQALAIRLLTTKGNCATMVSVATMGNWKKLLPPFTFLANMGATRLVRWLLEARSAFSKR